MVLRGIVFGWWGSESSSGFSQTIWLIMQFPGCFYAAWIESAGPPPWYKSAGGVMRSRGAILASEWCDRLLPCILLQSAVGHCYCDHTASLPSWGSLHCTKSFCFPFQNPALQFRYSCSCGCDCIRCSAGGHPWFGGCCLFLGLAWLLTTRNHGPPAGGLLNPTTEEQRGREVGNSMKHLCLETRFSANWT